MKKISSLKQVAFIDWLSTAMLPARTASPPPPTSLKNASRHRDEIPLTKYGKLEPLMTDTSVEEIWINSPHRIFVARSGVSELTTIVMSKEEVHDLVERLLMWGGRRLDLSHPFVDARLPDGSRLHASIPNVTAEHWAINIRKHLFSGKSLQDLVELKSLSSEMFELLKKAIDHNFNILVSGSTQSGKTTFLNALISETSPHSRIITAEEVFELRPRVADHVALQIRPANLEGHGEIPLRKLVKEALRMRPTHLIVGEIREAESLDMLIALNSGLPGMGTIHANSAREAIQKIQLLPLLAGENISQHFITALVAGTFDLVVHLGMNKSGVRRVQEIHYVSGRLENGRIETEVLFQIKSDDHVNDELDPVYTRGLGDLNRIFKPVGGEGADYF